MAGRIDPGFFGWRWPYTPTTARSHTKWDDLPPEDALVRAWTEPGRNLRWHRMCIQVVRDCMPVLARALDRLVDERGL